MKIHYGNLKASIHPDRRTGYFTLFYRIHRKQKSFSLKTKNITIAKDIALKKLMEVDNETMDRKRLSEILDLWLKYPKVRRPNYIDDVKLYFQWFTDYFNNCYIYELSKDDILKYITYLKNSKNKRTGLNLSTTSVSIRLRTIKSVLKWAYHNSYCSLNVFEGVPIPKSESRKEYLNPEQLNSMLDLAKNNYLEHGWLMLLINTGMRAGELHNLKWSEISEDYIKFIDTKTGSYTWHIPVDSKKIIKEAFTEIINHQKSECEYVFSDRYGKHLKNDTVIRFVKRWLIRAGHPNLSVHVLRHSFATNLLLAGVGLFQVKELMRHKTIQTTEKYLHVLTGKITGTDFLRLTYKQVIIGDKIFFINQKNELLDENYKKVSDIIET